MGKIVNIIKYNKVLFSQSPFFLFIIARITPTNERINATKKHGDANINHKTKPTALPSPSSVVITSAINMEDNTVIKDNIIATTILYFL